MPEPQWDAESRVGRVRQIAVRLYSDLKGESVREAMHALALTTAAVIRTSFRGNGQESALQQHIDNVKHHARKQ